ncbi:unnamed protein product [Adineta ricciae]|uniref:Choline/carnitine acyltransferase domain-containing protein n=1 Tax=Adineta ricciae TaxID=249248 RepID=A0A815CM17_ADIRI|nr:unnamed protein product [Adineta ricciae]CAF1286107.1 unnamed protein product [Adineta ricciae]
MKKTFEYDNNLPSLPLPTLEHTLERYLDSVRAVVDENDYAKTKEIVEQFAKGVGRELHEQLKARSKAENGRNWLAKWWDEEIYFKWRLPIAPTINMIGFSCLIPPKAGSQLERTCVHMHACALVFQNIREERYPISYMVSEDENSPPTHVVVIRNGLMYTFDLYQAGELLSPPEILRRLEDIMGRSEHKSGLGLGALTALPRDDWADVRDHLCHLDERNRRNLQTIEQALGVYAFDNENVENLTEAAGIGMLKNPQSRWFDRSMLYVVTRNGLVVTNSDHSAYEGIIPLQIGDLIQQHIDSLEQRTSCPVSAVPYDQNVVQELIFTYDDSITTSIDRAVNLFSRSVADIDLLVVNVTECSKEDIKQYVRMHPDTFFQLCLQLAYFKTHNYKPAATYETAATRKFFRGRTETLRTCTVEALAWCRAMTNQHDRYTDKDRRKLFHLAAKRHQELMSEASENQGCDRHLFGLSMIAYMTGQPFELSKDPSWTKSGGSGNFILSTSCIGFSTTTGGTMAMCWNGYGVFYRFGKEATTFVVTAYRNCPDTNAQILADSIKHTLIEVKNSFMTSNL